MSEQDDDLAPDTPGRMSFLDHLDELRRRIVYAVYSVLAALVIAFIFIQDILAFVTSAMIAATPSGKLLGTGSLDPIMVIFKPGLLVAIIIASPLILLQVWYFIAPGLYAKEKKLAIPFVLSATLLFLAGAWFGHDLAFPVTWAMMAAIVPGFMDWMPTWNDAFGLYLRIVLGLGIIFQMPVVVFVLARFGLVTPKFLIKNIKYAVLVIFVVAAVASPGQDPASQLLFAAPMMVLYLISIGVAWVFQKKKRVEND